MPKGEDITTRFKVDISDLKKGISEANKNIKLANAEFKAVSAGMDNWAKSSEGINAKLKQLNTVLTEQKNKLESYKKEQQELDKGYSENGKRADELRAKLQQLANQGVSKTSEEYRKYQKALSDVEKEQIANKKSSDDLKITILNQQGAINKTQKEIKQYTTTLDEMNNGFKRSEDVIENTTKGFTIMKGALASLVADGIRKVIDGMKEFVSETIEVGKKFSSAMSEVSAISGSTGDELELLRDKAKEMGAKTKFSATESAEAFKYMAMAGWKTEDMLNGIDGVLNLAAASGADLATTSDIVTDALTAMGYSAKDAGHLADVMAVASSNANTNVEMMGETFKYVAPVAGAMGYSMEDLSVAIGLMANAGIKSTQSGTALKNILTNMANPTDKMAYAMEYLGVSLQKSDGSMKSLKEIMCDLRKGFGDSKMSTEDFQKSLQALDKDLADGTITQKKYDEMLSDLCNNTFSAEGALKAQYAASLAGKEGMAGLLAIVNASDEDFNKLTDAVYDSTGAAQKMSDIMQNNLEGDLTKFKSKLESIKIALYEKLEPAIRKVVKSFQDWTESVNWDAFAKKVSKAIGKVINVFNWFVEHKNVVIGAISGMIAAFAVAKIGNFVSSMSSVITTMTKAPGIIAGVTSAMKALNLTALANPYVLLATAIAGVVTALGVWAYKSDEVTQTLVKERKEAENETKIVNDNKKAWDDLNESKQNNINTGMSEMQHYQELYDELTNIVDANGKVKEGYEGRASFITGTLSEALGIEIKTVDGVIQKYDDLKESFNKVMEKKKAMIVLEAQEAGYKEAITKKAELLRAQNELEQELADKKIERENILKQLEESTNMFETARLEKQLLDVNKTISEKEKQYDTQEEMLQEYAYNIGQYEANMALMHEEKYNEISNVDWQRVKTAQETGNQQKALLEQQIEDERSELDRLKALKEQHNTDIYNNQIKASEERLNQLQGEMNDYVATIEGGNENATTEWKEGLANQLSEATGKKVEFRDAGNGMVQKYVDGVAEGTPKAESAMKTMAENSIQEINKKESEADSAGQNLLKGALKGILNSNLQGQILNGLAVLGGKMIAKFKGSLDEHSPSKATREMGQFFLQGLALGINDKEKGILNQIKGVGESAKEALKSQLEDEIEIPTSLANAKNSLSQLKENLLNSVSSNGNSGNSTISNVNNFTQVINTPKQLSRIELYRQTRNLLKLKGA